ncbi:hypothetical protein AB205_0219240, partial [Aquarana catesbeiana]
MCGFFFQCSKAFFCCKVGVFSGNGGYLLKANPLCTTSAVSV